MAEMMDLYNEAENSVLGNGSKTLKIKSVEQT